MLDSELFQAMVKYFTKWSPEVWVEVGTPGYNDSKEIGLMVRRYKRKKSIIRRRQKSIEVRNELS